MPIFISIASSYQRTINIFISALLLLTLVSTNSHSLYIPLALATTDPISASVSATAKVPSTAPTTGDTIAPPSVVLISPHDGAVTNQSRPEFVWKTTLDSNSNNVSYTLYLNGVATYLGVSNTGNSQQHNYISHLGDGNIYLTPTLDLVEGTYDWYVRATDGSNNSSYSTTWRFKIDQTSPILTVLNIDDLYFNPDISEGTIFDLAGPQEVKLIFLTEAYATVSVTINTSDGETLSYSLPTTNSGLATLLVELPIGQNSIITSSFDSAGLTSTLPNFILNLNPAFYPGKTTRLYLPPLSMATNIPNNLVSLAATISQIYDTNMIAYLPYLLLAMCLSILLILIWKNSYNIQIINKTTQKPYRSVIVYHSRPTHSANITTSLKRLLVTNREPVLYQLNHNGRTHIHRLGRYSSLTIRTPDGLTHVLSLSKQQASYTLIL